MFKVSDILKWAGGKLVSGDKKASFKGVSIDSRTVKRGDLFIAIKGERFDGHDFIKEAFKKGASGAIVSRMATAHSPQPTARKVIIVVQDTVKALGDIAHNHRMRFKRLPVIAVTGSNGKTTTKELIVAVLSSRFSVLKSRNSYNNSIGLPLTLLDLNRKHTVCVLEMGMNRLGEIERLAAIARPTIGVITNIGPAHLESMDSLENIFMAKCELLDHLSGRSIAVLNKDDRFLKGIDRPGRKTLYFGIKERSDFQATDLSYKEGTRIFRLNGKYAIEAPLPGAHNVYNILAAAAVGRSMGISFEDIASSLKSFKSPCPGRMANLDVKGLRIIDDTYNANPVSMRCAIETLSEYKTAGKKILVAGDMLELGASSRALHEDMGRLVAGSDIDMLVTLGSLSKYMSEAALRCGMRREHIFQVGSYDMAHSILKRISSPGDVILVKGSRRMRMEEIIQLFAR